MLLRLIDDGPVVPVLIRVRQLVHGARSRQRRDRRPLGLGGMARCESDRGVLLVGPGRLSPTNQVNERSKVNTGNLDDVVTFLP
jgi:hypothetical protein